MEGRRRPRTAGNLGRPGDSSRWSSSVQPWRPPATPWRRCIVAEDVVDGVRHSRRGRCGPRGFAAPGTALGLHRGCQGPPPQKAWVHAADHASRGSRELAVGRFQAAQQGGAGHCRCGICRGRGTGPHPAFPAGGGETRTAVKLPRFGDGSEEAAAERVEDLATGSVELSDVVGATTLTSTTGTARGS
jgi:hypothetical protein